MYQSYPIAARRPHERFDAFRQIVDSVFCPMQIEPDRAARGCFDATIEAANLGNVHVVRVSTSPLAVRRRRAPLHTNR